MKKGVTTRPSRAPGMLESPFLARYAYLLSSPTIPISIFSHELSPLESVVAYLKGQGWTFGQIASTLGRDERTIWRTFDNAKKKTIPVFSTILATQHIPLELFADRSLSILEHIVYFMREVCQKKNSEIAEQLNRHRKTIWTAYQRAQEKQQ